MWEEDSLILGQDTRCCHMVSLHEIWLKRDQVGLKMDQRAKKRFKRAKNTVFLPQKA